MRAALLVLAAGPVAAEELVVPRLVEETATAGIESSFEGEWEYMVGGGVAAFDCSGDDRPDLAFAGGTAPASVWVNRAEPGGALRFAGAASGIELEAVLGAYPFDADGDGVQDLFLLRQGENVVMRGLGECRFERANEAWGLDGGDAWHSAFAATWEAGAAWPTLAVGAYIDPKEELFPWGSCTDNWLFRPGGDGWGAPLSLSPSFCALSMLFTDWDRSGTPALRVSNDREYYKGGQEQMWRLPPGEAPILYGEADGWARLRIWGMGIAGQDIDGDGFAEYALTSMADNKLQRLAVPGPGARPAYSDVAYALGATAHRPYTGGDLRPSTAWHVEWGDVNNDGRPDLYIVKGNVAEMPDFAAEDPNNLLLMQADGTFREVGDVAGVASMGVGRGGTLVDLNDDGLLDMVATNRWAPAQVWRNVTEGAPEGAMLRLSQDGPNRDAVGAWVEWRSPAGAFAREVTVGGGHAGGQIGWIHVAGGVEARVVWPGGEATGWFAVAPGDRLRVDREDGVAAAE